MLAIKKGLGRGPTRGCKYGERAGNSIKLDCPFDIQGKKRLGKFATKRFCTFRDAQNPLEHTAPMSPGLFRGTVLFVSCGQRRAWNANFPSAPTVPFIQLLPHHQFTTSDLQAKSKPNGWTPSFYSETTSQASSSAIINEKIKGETERGNYFKSPRAKSTCSYRSTPAPGRAGQASPRSATAPGSRASQASAPRGGRQPWADSKPKGNTPSSQARPPPQPNIPSPPGPGQASTQHPPPIAAAAASHPARPRFRPPRPPARGTLGDVVLPRPSGGAGRSPPAALSFQWLITLPEEKFVLVSSLNLRGAASCPPAAVCLGEEVNPHLTAPSSPFCFSWLLVKNGDMTAWLNDWRKQ